MLEAGLYADNSFATLTYAENPVSLRPLHHRQFMDALRKSVAPLRVRFYMVGEYGELNDRPHFHYALFGYPSCRRPVRRSSNKFRCCAPCDRIEDVWGKGFIQNKPLEIGSARYIARYVVKKMTRQDDPRLEHRYWVGRRHPEFSRMSLKPGIGHGVLDAVANTITRYNLLTPQGDVPVTLRHGDLEWPLGRYLRRKLRLKLGLDERSPDVLTPEASYEAYQSNTALQAVHQAARASEENPSVKFHLLKASEAQRMQIAARNNFFKKSGSL